MRVDLVAIGTHGDVLPIIALGHALRQRGHAVALLAPAPFQAMAERAGLAFTPLGDRDAFARSLAADDLWHPRRGARPFLDLVSGTIEPVYAWLAGRWGPHNAAEGVVVATTLCLGARVAEERLLINLATVHMLPMLMESRHASPWLPGMPGLLRSSRLRHLFSRGADEYVIDPQVLPALNAFRAGLGITHTVKRLRHWWSCAAELILMFPGWYAPPQIDWPERAVQVGFPFADRFGDASELDPELADFLDAGPPPLVFTYGSGMPGGADFYATAAAICRRTGRRGVLLASASAGVPEDLPRGVLRRAYAPLSRLLPRSRALIHHGGIGTVAQALAAGLPQLVVPVAFNHFDEARRLRRLELGTSLPRRLFTPARAARRLERLLASTRVAQACEEARRHMLRQDGVTAACDVVEGLAARRVRREADQNALR